MSREEAMKAFIESGMELRRDDIELGKRLERERIIKLLEPEVTRHYELGLDASAAYLEQTIKLIKGEQK